MADSVRAVLVDHDIEGQARLIWRELSAGGWDKLLSIDLFTLEDVGLPQNTDDRTVWRFCQQYQMLLLTNNRNMDDDNSLERTLREENRLDSLPVLTIGNRDRLTNRSYVTQCADNIVEIIMDIKNHVGRERIFIPEQPR